MLFKVIFILVVIILGLLLAAFVYFEARTISTRRDPQQKVFSTGTLPNNLDGFYRGGNLTESDSWQGKTFDQKSGLGINNFGKNIKKYQFKFYSSVSLSDPNLRVLKLNYNLSSNPWWLRFVTDELVETKESGHYLGKIQLDAFGLKFSLGYFNLQK